MKPLVRRIGLRQNKDVCIGIAVVIAVLGILYSISAPNHGKPTCTSVPPKNLMQQPVENTVSLNDPRWEPYNAKLKADPKFEWKSLIQFHGKVVDENGFPVAGAEISFVWTDLSSKGTSDAHCVSRSDGLFSLSGLQGKSLSVRIEKAGYHVSNNLNRFRFEYAAFWDPEYHQDAPDTPVIFHLVKKLDPEPVIYWAHRRIIVPAPEKTISLDLLSKINTRQTISKDLEVKLFRDTNYTQLRSQTPFNWNITVKGVGGSELAPTDQEFMMRAPDDGYLPELTLSMDKLSKDWKNHADLKFFVRNHSRGFYAAIQLRVDPEYKISDPRVAGAVFITAIINPRDSPIVEFDKSKTIR
jgi:hypothetical protein